MNKKTIVWTSILLIFIIIFSIAGTYAFFNIQPIKRGSFEVEITSKGVDTLTISDKKDLFIEANKHNFAKGIGHNLVSEAIINPKLETTNKYAKYCFVINIQLPEEKIFSYSQENNPELLLDVESSKDGVNYNNIISSMDITTKTGLISVPISKNSNDFINVLEVNKGKVSEYYYKARLTLVYYPNVDQTINDNKSYTAYLKANVVSC